MSQRQSELQLFSNQGERLYLNQHERQRFLEAAQSKAEEQRLFAQVLFYTGCRPTEVRNLTKQQIDCDSATITLRSLKKTSKHFRHVPIPQHFAKALKNHLGRIESQKSRVWPVDRSTAFRWIKSTMRDAGITGAKSCSRGLRHSFGVHCILSGIPLPMLQRWMGHSDPRTTMIYLQIVGTEERELAQRMW